MSSSDRCPSPDSAAKRQKLSISDFAIGLREGEEGIWFSESAASCSYPEEGHAFCYALEEDSFWFRHRNDAIISLVQAFPPNGFILDVGGGNGFVSWGLHQAGFQTVMLEPGLTGARNAKGRGINSVVCSTLENANFKSRVIPAIGLFDVLEHIEDPLGFLRNFARILAPGGRLYLSVPALACLWSSDDVTAGHYRRYSLRTLLPLLGAAGFEIDFATYLFFYLALPIFLVRKLRLRAGLTPKGPPVLQETKTQLRPSLGPLSIFLRMANRLEMSCLRRGKRIPFGSSILLAAHLKGTHDYA
jgi:SAM-dependent methyltransferase